MFPCIDYDTVMPVADFEERSCRGQESCRRGVQGGAWWGSQHHLVAKTVRLVQTLEQHGFVRIAKLVEQIQVRRFSGSKQQKGEVGMFMTQIGMH